MQAPCLRVRGGQRVRSTDADMPTDREYCMIIRLQADALRLAEHQLQQLSGVTVTDRPDLITAPADVVWTTDHKQLLDFIDEVQELAEEVCGSEILMS